jgi:hypothetical protein
VSIGKTIATVLLVPLTFGIAFFGILLLGAWCEVLPPELPRATVPIYVLIQLGVPSALAMLAWGTLRRRWGGRRPTAVPSRWKRAAAWGLAIGYASTAVFGVPAVQSDQTAWAVAEYKRVKERSPQRVFEQHPYIRSFAALPAAPGVVLSYHEYQLDGLYGLGAFELSVWYGVGTRSLGCLPLWIS